MKYEAVGQIPSSSECSVISLQMKRWFYHVLFFSIPLLVSSLNCWESTFGWVAFATLYMKQPNSFDTCLSCQVQHEHRSDQSDDVDQDHSKNSKRLPFERCFSLCQIAVLPCYKFYVVFFFQETFSDL